MLYRGFIQHNNTKTNITLNRNKCNTFSKTLGPSELSAYLGHTGTRGSMRNHVNDDIWSTEYRGLILEVMH